MVAAAASACKWLGPALAACACSMLALVYTPPSPSASPLAAWWLQPPPPVLGCKWLGGLALVAITRLYFELVFAAVAINPAACSRVAAADSTCKGLGLALIALARSILALVFAAIACNQSCRLQHSFCSLLRLQVAWLSPRRLCSFDARLGPCHQPRHQLVAVLTISLAACSMDMVAAVASAGKRLGSLLPPRPEDYTRPSVFAAFSLTACSVVAGYHLPPASGLASSSLHHCSHNAHGGL